MTQLGYMRKLGVKKATFIAVVVLVLIPTMQFLLFTTGYSNAATVHPGATLRSYRAIENALGPPDLGAKSPVTISVVIPVYKVSRYIERCVRSLIFQTFRDIEYIFVDDCGGDGSIEVVERYAQRDKRIKIIYNKENMGSGPSRNAGLQAASGRYVSFIDPDDYVSRHFYERLARKVNFNYDIIKGGRINQYQNLTRIPSGYNRVLLNDLRRGCKLFEIFHYEHQTALYRRGVITEHPDIRFGKSVAAQDCTFMLAFTFYTHNISFVNDAFYSYCLRDDSVVNEQGYNFFHGNAVSMNDRLNFLEAHAPPGSYNDYLLLYERIMKQRQDLLRASKMLSPSVITTLDAEYTMVIARTHSLIKLPFLKMLFVKISDIFKFIKSIFI